MPTTSATPAAPMYAGFWRRVAAYYIDSIVVMIPVALIIVPFAFFGETLATIGTVLALVVMFGYFVVMHSSAWQATVGKRVLGVKVTDLEGNRIGIGRSLVRLLGSFVSSLILGVGYLMAGFTQKRQALHDMIAGTLVVRKDAAPGEIVAGGGPMPITVGVWVTLVLLIVLPFVLGLVSAIVFPS
jgi:uncharacterized RDD family membrane protein YckC